MNRKQETSEKAGPSHYRQWLILAVVVATLIKLWLALKTDGTHDIPAFQDQLHKLREYGADSYNLIGAFGNPQNLVPFVLNLPRMAEFLAHVTGMRFAFWMRLPNIIADAGSVWLVYLIIRRSRQAGGHQFYALLLMALCPTSLIISGFHGNIDPSLIFLVLLTLFFIISGRPVWLSAIIFGMALNIKVVPLMFAPALFFYFPRFRQRLVFFFIAVLVFFAGSLPYMLQNPGAIFRSVFGYSSAYGVWGWTLLVRLWVSQPVDNYHPSGFHGTVAALGKYLMLGFIVALAFAMNRTKRMPLFLQFGAISFAFMFLTPGFGTQYLTWLVPFVVALGLAPTIISYVSSALYLFTFYGCWALTTHPDFLPPRALTIVCQIGLDRYLSLLCWLCTLVILIFIAALSGRLIEKPIHIPERVSWPL